MFPAVAWGQWVLWDWLLPCTSPGLEGGRQRSGGASENPLFVHLSMSGLPDSFQNCTSCLRTREPKARGALQRARPAGAAVSGGGKVSRAEKAGTAGGTRKHFCVWHLLAQRTLRHSRQASWRPDSCHLVLKLPCFLLAKLIPRLPRQSGWVCL